MPLLKADLSEYQTMTTPATPHRNPFLLGVFLITMAVLLFQVVQTRILSVIAWYYLAFFAISVAMLGMTAGGVWVYLNRARLTPEKLSTLLADTSLLTAIAMPLSIMVQFCLVTNLMPVVTVIFAWTLLMAAMTIPYVFAGITVSLALTRSPFPINLVYGVDLLGAALGCIGVVLVLNVLDGPSVTLFAGLLAALAALAFVRAATPSEQVALRQRWAWRRPLPVAVCLALLIPLNMAMPYGFKPMLVKNKVEHSFNNRFEKWNSFSRIVAYPPTTGTPQMWGASPQFDANQVVEQAWLDIDGAAGTAMTRFDGTRQSIDFLRYDVVNLAYYLPGIRKSAVIGVGGGRDLLSANLFGVQDITGVEVNRIFVDLHTTDPVYAPYSNLMSIPGLRLHVDDARSWFAATDESFDLIQMSMIDTWAATGAGAFSLSENGLYTLEGWRAFTSRLTDDGVFTVSRWYSASDINESGRMVALAMAVLMDRGVEDPRQHIFIANANSIATLVLSKSPFTAEKLQRLREETERLHFTVLIAPGQEPESETLQRIMAATDLESLDRATRNTFLDLSVPTDNRPFFFNQLRFSDIPHFIAETIQRRLGPGVVGGNLRASIALVMILVIALVAVIATIVFPLRSVAASAPRQLVIRGTMYFALIGAGFMFAEISILQFFGVFLGHPTYAMSVCLFSLILSTGLGSLASAYCPLDSARRFAIWGALVGAYLLVAQWGLASLFESTTAQALPVRILISLAVVMPVGFLMGFAFPTGMLLVEKIDSEATPWFWAINGAVGVLASVLAVMVSMAHGINVTMLLAALCYLALIPVARALLPAPAGK